MLCVVAVIMYVPLLPNDIKLSRETGGWMGAIGGQATCWQARLAARSVPEAGLSLKHVLSRRLEAGWDRKKGRGRNCYVATPRFTSEAPETTILRDYIDPLIMYKTRNKLQDTQTN